MLEYDEMLRDICEDYHGDIELVVPIFNMKVHKFDEETRRKARRFKREEV